MAFAIEDEEAPSAEENVALAAQLLDASPQPVLEEMLRLARRNAAREVHLEVRPSNTAARRLYESLGFTQVGTRPPAFLLFANRRLPRGHPYRRYLVNALRREAGLPGVPIRLTVRRR